MAWELGEGLPLHVWSFTVGLVLFSGDGYQCSGDDVFGLEWSSLNMVENIGGSAPNICDQQDQLLPIANVGRIMKQILPPNAKISKEAKETMQECVSEFISFVTGEASEKCRKERRKTVNGDDICWALGTLGFDDYTGPLRRYLHRYRDQEGADHQHRAINDNEDKLKQLANDSILGSNQAPRMMMIMNQYDHPHHDIQKT